MAQTPQFTSRDGTTTTTNLVFTTNQENVSLEGLVDINTVDVQVSLNGSAFVSDPTLVLLDGLNFTVPNPNSFPDGLSLRQGNNTIAVRAIDIVGSVSPPATATITRSLGFGLTEALIPSGIRLRRRRDTVDLLAAKPEFIPTGEGIGLLGLFEFRGFNFYASTSPSGTTGYFKINDKIVTETSSTVIEEDELPLQENQVEFLLSDFSGEADRLRIRTTLEDQFGNETDVVQEVFVELSPNPEDPEIGTTARPIRVVHNTSEFERTEFVRFRHDRGAGTESNTINSDQWVDVDDSEPLYYVVRGVFYNVSTQEEFETPSSQEVLGAPLVIDTRIRDLPGRTQLQVVTDYVAAVQRVNDEIALIPGSTTRDVSIDPFSSEAERIWFVVDFVHRSQSFLTLLQIDDANEDGITDPVISSAYKQALKAALGLSNDATVQGLIDQQFDKLAGNFQRTRLPGRPAVGQVVFYTTNRPGQDITIPSGTLVSTDSDESGVSATFTVGGTFVLSADNADAFFNFETQRYEVVADVVAITPGASGNQSAGKITNVQGSVGGLSVTNTEATVFGSDRESNSDLATRSQLAFVSVDTGTEGGYAKTAAEQVGIIKTKIVKSGDDLMMRDYDEVRGKHIGGKVDIWVQGLQERTVNETFAFSFEIARDIRCQIIDVATLTFRVLDDRVTTNTPLVELLDNPGQGLGVRNVTLGQDYDLTGVTIVDFETFQLDPGIQVFVTNIDDIVTADYRFQSINQFQFSFQPVRRVISVVGEVSGALNIDLGFQLFKTGDPLLEGESTIAEDFLLVNQVGGIPTGATITVNDEQHVMIGFFEERLQSVGINTATLRVYNQDRTVEYDGPGTATPDYEVIPGTATTPVSITRTTTSAITSGETVSVDYDHDENFTVTYVINDLLQQLQKTVNAQRHVTADVLVKQAINNEVDLETTIQLKQGASKDTTDPAVRTNVSTELNTKLIGQGTAQSDMINAIDSTDGVDFQVLPLARMGYADGSRKLRDTVQSSNVRLGSLDIGGNQVFILTNALQFPTTDGGGAETEHKGVFQDDIAMVLASSLTNVGEFQNQAYIIGATGASITGYSDDATLIADGFTDPDDIAAERLDRTANHVVVSLSGAGTPPDSPDNHAYACSYVVRDDRGPHDITASDVEFLGLGDLTLTFRNAT